MLPFDDEGGEGGEGGGHYPFNYETYNDFGVHFDNFQEAAGFYDALSDYMHDQGFSNEAWFSMVTEIHEFSIWQDDEGNMHYFIDFDWWYEDGGYGGHASASA